MKQEEKSKMSYEKILNAAIEEFGTDSYENTSMNSICKKHSISKGLIYHYFENKDELYLCCVKSCFDELIAFFDQKDFTRNSMKENMNSYMKLRYQFFQQNPKLCKIFFQTVLYPPKHLIEQIKGLRKNLDLQNIRLFQSILHNVTLRDTITEERVIAYLVMFQEMFNGYLQSKVNDHTDFDFLVKEHEEQMFEFLDIMIHGIVKEESK